jgi:pimeloyl-ACP methyl ester carboxylesterase/DNA-binding CsgD family transcriptional regulator
MLSQRVHYCRSFDGAAIAFATSGRGRPILMLPSWVSHLEHQWRSSAWRPWLEALSKDRTLVRYDPRGCGLSERSATGLSFETWVRDAEAVADAAGLDRFSIVGIWQGGALAVALAQRAPERIERLVLFGAYARGRLHRDLFPQARERARLLKEILRIGWNDSDHGLIRAFAALVQPRGSIEHLNSWCELQQRSASSEAAVAIMHIAFNIDVRDAARQISCPTLVAHADRDAVVPLAEGRLLASLIPQAQFLELESVNHLMLPDEPAWRRFRAALDEFLEPSPHPSNAFSTLTVREREVLDLLARGLDNAHIASALGISPKTVRNHMLALFDKINVGGRGEAIVVAREAGFGCEPVGTQVLVRKHP